MAQPAGSEGGTLNNMIRRYFNGSGQRQLTLQSLIALTYYMLSLRGPLVGRKARHSNILQLRQECALSN